MHQGAGYTLDDGFWPTASTAKATSCEGDANNDGAVDVKDISYVLFRLGDTC